MKLLAGIGAWIGVFGVLKVFAVAAIIGMIIVIVQSYRAGNLSAVLRRSALVTINTVRADVSGVQNVLDTSRGAAPSAETHLPYAVPALIAVLFVVLV